MRPQPPPPRRSSSSARLLTLSFSFPLTRILIAGGGRRSRWPTPQTLSHFSLSRHLARSFARPIRPSPSLSLSPSLPRSAFSPRLAGSSCLENQSSFSLLRRFRARLAKPFNTAPDHRVGALATPRSRLAKCNVPTPRARFFAAGECIFARFSIFTLSGLMQRVVPPLCVLISICEKRAIKRGFGLYKRLAHDL